VAVPGLQREAINPLIYSKKFNEVGGLARLLLLESRFLKEKTFDTDVSAFGLKRTQQEKFRAKPRSKQIIENNEQIILEILFKDQRSAATTLR
jgi:hypothetical protein